MFSFLIETFDYKQRNSNNSSASSTRNSNVDSDIDIEIFVAYAQWWLATYIDCTREYFGCTRCRYTEWFERGYNTNFWVVRFVNEYFIVIYFSEQIHFCSCLSSSFSGLFGSGGSSSSTKDVSPKRTTVKHSSTNDQLAPTDETISSERSTIERYEDFPLMIHFTLLCFF